jgi:hypothetical protein
MRLVNNILTEINGAIAQNLPGISFKFWGEAALHEQDEKTFPVVSGGDGDGTIISFDDVYAMQIYHRVLDIENRESPDSGYGSSVRRFRDINMRLVGIGLRSKFTERTWETNTDILSMIYQALPIDLTYEILIPGDEQPNKMTVMDSEFAGHEYGHLKLDLIAFWIEYAVQQRADCGDISNDPLITLNNITALVGGSYVFT